MPEFRTNFATGPFSWATAPSRERGRPARFIIAKYLSAKERAGRPRSRESFWLRMPLVLFVGFTLTIIAATLVFGINGYPVPTSDFPYFAAPAISYAGGQGLIAPLFYRAYLLDPSGEARFTYNGFLQPMLIGTLLPEGNGPNYILIFSVITALAICLIALTFVYTTKIAGRPFGWIDLAVCGSTLGALAAVFLHNHGRPEALSSIWLSLLILAGLRSRSLVRVNVLAAAALIGLLALTTPPALVYGALIYGLAAAFELEPKRWAVCCMRMGVLAACVIACAVYLVYPFPAGDLWHGITGAVAHQAGLNLSAFRTVYLQMRYWPYLAYLAGTLVFFGAVAAVSALTAARTKVLFAAQLLLLAGFTLFSIRDPWSVYRLFPVLPLLALLALSLCGTPLFFNGGFRLSRSMRTAAAFLIICGTLPTAQGLQRTAADFLLYRHDGTTLEQARAVFAKVIARYPGIVGITNTLTPLSEDFHKLRVVAPVESVVKPWAGQPAVEAMIVQQDVCDHAERALPPLGYELRDDFTRREARGRSGYGFCVFERLPG